MKNDTCLTFRDLNKMDKLLKTSVATVSNSELTELDQLAIKLIDDMQQYPTRRFYNLRMFNSYKAPQNRNSFIVSKLNKAKVLSPMQKQAFYNNLMQKLEHFNAIKEHDHSYSSLQPGLKS